VKLINKWFSFVVHNSGQRIFNITCLFINILDISSVSVGPIINNKQLHVYLMFACNKEQYNSSAN
jgi:hypothetical protein